MITCPSCNHQNPEGSLQCENCYTPLPATTSCPNCGASVQTDATFCGQCGFNLQAENSPVAASLEETAVGSLPNMSLEEISLPDEIPLSSGNPDILPETSVSSPIQSPWDDQEEDQTIGQTAELPTGFPEIEPQETIEPTMNQTETEFAEDTSSSSSEEIMSVSVETPDFDLEPTVSATESEVFEASKTQEKISFAAENQTQTASSSEIGIAATENMAGATQLQIQKAALLHLQSNTTIEIPSDLDVVHLGKPNNQIPPDVDVSGFPDSEVVSRVHADIRIEGDAYFIEDTMSSNGTYINHAPLQKGNRHRLRTGDRIALGKGDLVTFIFQLN